MMSSSRILYESIRGVQRKSSDDLNLMLQLKSLTWSPCSSLRLLNWDDVDFNSTLLTSTVFDHHFSTRHLLLFLFVEFSSIFNRSRKIILHASASVSVIIHTLSDRDMISHQRVRHQKDVLFQISFSSQVLLNFVAEISFCRHQGLQDAFVYHFEKRSHTSSNN